MLLQLSAEPRACNIYTPPSRPQPATLQVTWGDTTAVQGIELTPTIVQAQPVVKWTGGSADDLYTIVYSDPDAPSTTDRKFGEWLHWLVVNVPGDECDPASGDVIAAYVGSAPGEGSGKHRYCVLLYKQASRIDVAALGEPYPISATSGFVPRRSFNSRAFAATHGLAAIDGVGFLAEYDDLVPDLHKTLNSKA